MEEAAWGQLALSPRKDPVDHLTATFAYLWPLSYKVYKLQHCHRPGG